MVDSRRSLRNSRSRPEITATQPTDRVSSERRGERALSRWASSGRGAMGDRVPSKSKATSQRCGSEPWSVAAIAVRFPPPVVLEGIL
jgi:hypothetical protein